jgi:allantoinase
MEYAASLQKIVAVHAENEMLTAGLAQEALMQGRTGIRDYIASRPIVAELEAIARAILFAQQTACALHIMHVSTGRGVRMVADARAQGYDISCETCPRYLVMTEEDVEAIGALALCAPPIRSRREQDELWRQIYRGTLPMVASGHSPASSQMKYGTNFFSVWRGISGGQTLLPLLLTAGYQRRHLNLSLIASMTSEYVARRFHVGPRKGSLLVGADADLTLVALQDSMILTAQDLFYRYPQSPYVGLTLHGRIVRTIVRGITVFLEGHIVSEPIGRLLQITA